MPLRDREARLAYFREYNRKRPKRSELTPDELARIRARDRAKEWANRERRLRQKRERYYLNLDKERARQKARIASGRAALATRKWREKNPDYHKKWWAADRERTRMYERRKRARKAGAEGSHTEREWLEKCELLGNVCFYCGEARLLTEDHKVPLSRGGTDYIDNIVPACVPCNSSKHDKTVEEFLAWRRAA